MKSKRRKAPLPTASPTTTTPPTIRSQIMELLRGAIATQALTDQYGQRVIVRQGDALTPEAIAIILDQRLLRYTPVRSDLLTRAEEIWDLLRQKAERMEALENEIERVAA